MAANSPNKYEPKLPEINEEVDMKRHVFKLGLLFKSSQIFWKIVRNRAVMD